MIILYASSAIDKIFGNGFIGMDKRRLLNWIHKTAACPVRCCLVSNSMNVKINIKNNKNMKATQDLANFVSKKGETLRTMTQKRSHDDFKICT